MNIRLKECIENREQYILQLCSMADEVLARKIDLIHEQLQMAHEEKNTDALELLQEWLQQVIAARIKKDTEKIADAEDEMEIEVERFEVMAQLTNDRTKVLEDLSVTDMQSAGSPSEDPAETEPEKPKDEQLKLF